MENKQNTNNKKKIKERALNYIKRNRVIFLYAVFAISIEMIAVFAVEGNPIMTQPYIFICVVGVISSLILLINNNKIRFILCTILIIGQTLADLALVVVFDMTGQYFDYGMLSLRNDAWGILESIPMNFIAFYLSLLCCIVFVVFGYRSIKRIPKVKVNSGMRVIECIAGALFMTCIGAFLTINNSENVNKYVKMIKNTEGSNYASMGLIGNFINEMSKGLIFTDMEYMKNEDIDNFIYNKVTENSPNFGISKDNNVVVMLVESFEWFSFVKSEEYPNGLDLSKEDIEYLFPNLTKFYNNSIVMNNFHSKEKTDISETISILGSYPTEAYVDYDFEYNTIPNTLPNTIRALEGGDIASNSFHNGYKSFYNREKTHKIFGFDSLTDSYDMYKISDEAVKSGKAKTPLITDYMSEGERNLDSEMIETCKDMMFPKDKRFFTYITTITMHGMYYERENLKEYVDKLNSVYTPKTNSDEEKILMNYVTTVMEFDKAVGVMMEDLEKKGLLDKTTIVMFGDHNSYYQQLSNYVKDIENYNTERNYTDLYKVPLMIYDSNLKHQVIEKFTCTSDIVPTVFDLLGINTYENMYYGTSVFNDRQSVLYSRAYGIFVGDGMVFRSLNDQLYVNKNVTNQYKNDFTKEGDKLVEKIKYCDQIFYQDYFADKKNYNTFIEKLKEIQ